MGFKIDLLLIPKIMFVWVGLAQGWFTWPIVILAVLSDIHFYFTMRYNK